MTPHTHAPRPLDLVALVSFDGEVYENQAVTRDRLGGAQQAPHVLGAAIQQWLGRGRHMWIDVRGRQIQGVATARPLAGQSAWEIDTLVDAGEHEGEVALALLNQATEAAADAGVLRLVLRMHVDAPALVAAQRAGFTRAMYEQLWSGALEAPREAAPPSLTVRKVEEQDAFALFQLYNRALPIDCRQALAVTFEEWQAVQERRWLGRGAHELVALEEDHARAALSMSGNGQLSLLAEPDADHAAGALLSAAAAHLEGARVLALLSQTPATPHALLRDSGLAPGEEYVLLTQRTASPIREALPSTAGRTVPTRG
jgi:hypothetical protein